MNHEVIVFEADTVTMIAVLRSLGRAGYRPHALSAQADAMGFRSRFSFKSAVHPDYQSDGFVPWFREYVASHPVRGIVAGEAFLNVIADDYAEFEHLIPDKASGATRALCLSKARVWEHLSQDSAAGRFMPQSGIFDSAESVETFCASHPEGATFYLKPDWEFTKSVLGRPRVVRADGFGEMRAKADSSLRDYSKILWQGHVSGMQVGVSLWRHNGRFVAENMVLGQHTYPHNAGNMSLRRSWWHEAILADAKAKLASLDWCGVAMMEYIWSPERDDFWFIEVNPRFWGYLHLDLACNKDFPRWQMDAHFGQLFESSGPPTRPATMRYVAPGEVIYVASRCLDPDVGIGRKLYSLAEFLVLGVNPLIGADMWFAGDRYMYVRRWYRFLREVPSTVLRAIRRGRTST